MSPIRVSTTRGESKANNSSQGAPKETKTWVHKGDNDGPITPERTKSPCMQLEFSNSAHLQTSWEDKFFNQPNSGAHKCGWLSRRLPCWLHPPWHTQHPWLPSPPDGGLSFPLLCWISSACRMLVKRCRKEKSQNNRSQLQYIYIFLKTYMFNIQKFNSLVSSF